MEKVRYTISDAAQMMDVESHALRYWEEELDLSVPRTGIIPKRILSNFKR